MYDQSDEPVDGHNRFHLDLIAASSSGVIAAVEFVFDQFPDFYPLA
jgi:hypothetical protein